jgi:hypothetical protein
MTITSVRRSSGAVLSIAIVMVFMLSGCAADGVWTASTKGQVVPTSLEGDASVAPTVVEPTPSDTATPGGGPGTLPSDWPTSIPAVEEGTLDSAYSDSGTYTATYSLTSSPADAASTFEASLVKAGFTKVDAPDATDISDGDNYTGNGLQINVYTLDNGDGTGALLITATAG